MRSSTTLTQRCQARLISAWTWALRWYTHHMPFARGRGIFIRPIEYLKRRGWPSPVTHISDRLVMEFEPSLLGWTLFEKGQWEPQQTSVMLSFLEAGDIVMNIGANTGYYALLAAERVGSRGHVHAFEIQPPVIDLLRRNIATNGLNDRVTVVEAGCFSSEGHAVIESRGDPGSARISFTGGGVRVPLVTLDQYAQTVALERLDLILIDAEGADFEILKGASQTLERFHPVVIAEVHHLSAFNGTEEQLRKYMEQFGYAARSLQGEFSRDLLFVV